MQPKEMCKIMNSKLVYIPALLLSSEQIWRPDYTFYYPGLLRSAAHGDMLPQSAREKCFIFGDSGGYSLLTQSVDPATYTANYVIEFGNMVCDGIATLDYPPVTSMIGPIQTKLHYVDDVEYKRRLEFSAENARYMREHKRKDLLLYTVVQGNTWERLNEWFTLSDPNHESDSVAIGPKPPSGVDSLISHLSFISSIKQIKNVHVFAIASYKAIAMIEYAIRKSSHLECVTFDSTEWADGTRLRVMYSPLTLQREILGSMSKKYIRAPCDCPACMSHDWAEGPLPPEKLDLHNLYHLSRRTRYLSALSTEDLEALLITKIGQYKFEEFRDSLELGYENVRHNRKNLFDFI